MLFIVYTNMSLLIMFIQYTYQTVLATDGRRSFAIFIYDNPASHDLLIGDQIGFTAGDRVRVSNVQKDSIGTTNVFRIDGMYSSSPLLPYLASLHSNRATPPKKE